MWSSRWGQHRPSPPHGQAEAAKPAQGQAFSSLPPKLLTYIYIYLYLCVYNDFSSCFPVCKSFHYRAQQEKSCMELHKLCCAFTPEHPALGRGAGSHPNPSCSLKCMQKHLYRQPRGCAGCCRPAGAAGPPLRMLRGGRCLAPGPSPCRWG